MDRRGAGAIHPRHGRWAGHRAGGRRSRLSRNLSQALLGQIGKGPRILLGFLLVIGGVLGFLPILGFWMLPLGAIVLCREIPAVARLVERVQQRWRRRRLSSGGG
jgi:hypothetical protein